MPTLRKIGRTYYADIYLGGARVRRKLSTDKKVAEGMLADLVKERDATRYGHPTKDMGWQAFKTKYLAYSRGAKKARTTYRDGQAIKSLEGYRTPDKVDSITPEMLEQWCASRKGEKKAPATIARDLNAVKAMMRKAAAWRYATMHDWASVKPPKGTRGRLLFWTADELGRIIRKCATEYPAKSSGDSPHDWETLALLGARSGLRRGEILHLSWQDVDLERGMLSVTPKKCPCCADGKWEPKDYEQRHLPMPEDLTAHLRRLKRTTDWVLGKRPAEGTATTYFRRIVKKAGLKGSIHTLRHTYASHLAQAGVPLFTIMKLLGHATMRTTMIYAHLCPESYEEAVQRLPVLSLVKKPVKAPSKK